MGDAAAGRERIGNFVVLGRIGKGGMGAVYKAEDPALHRIVALKLLPADLAADADFVARFQNEAAAAAQLSHTHLVQVYAAGEDAGTHFIAMEYVDGASLRDLKCDPAVAAQNAAVLREIRTLAKINDLSAAAFLRSAPATTPAASPRAGVATPTFQKSSVTVLSPKHQLERFVEEMKKLNPAFDGLVEPEIEKGQVVGLKLCTVGVTRISPVRDFPNLQRLTCGGVLTAAGFVSRQGDLEDLSPLLGLPLETLQCPVNRIQDLSPLRGMPLNTLYCDWNSKLHDLAPLANLPLTFLSCTGTRVHDVSALKGMRLENLQIQGTGLSDLEFIRRMPLAKLYCDFVPERDAEALRSIKTLDTINHVAVKEFWKRVAAGDIPK